MSGAGAFVSAIAPEKHCQCDACVVSVSRNKHRSGVEKKKPRV
jgi:hypothetical protein